MSKVKLGRPKGKATLDKAVIIDRALMILDENGSEGLSMRSLASRLGVTPMALYKHFADRASLLRRVSDHVYGEVTRRFERFTGEPKEKMEFLLLTYHRAVIDHPNLAISIFKDPSGFSVEVQKITDSLRTLFGETHLTKLKKELWLDILVDFTHGSSIAISLNQLSQKKQLNSKEQSLKYQKELRLLLDGIFG